VGHASLEHEFESQEEQMADQQELRGSNLEKDPNQWKTGDEPMTGAQASYLKTLSDQASESFDDALTKAEASKRIDELQERTGRGQP
jgi:phage tail tube protein FII